MLQLRRDAAAVLRSVRSGQPCLLTYRGEPVARLEPIAPPKDAFKDDPIYKLCDHAVDDGTPLTNREIDDLLYG